MLKWASLIVVFVFALYWKLERGGNDLHIHVPEFSLPEINLPDLWDKPPSKVAQSDELGLIVSPRPKLSPRHNQITKPPTRDKPPSAVNPSTIRVVDGDTIRVGSSDQRIRLVGFNTPETWKPVCDHGYALGKQATARLTELLRDANTAEVEIVPCACKLGTQGTKACNFGRECAYLRVDSVDVGDTLISEGLAARFDCDATTCPRLPRPWCE